MGVDNSHRSRRAQAPIVGLDSQRRAEILTRAIEAMRIGVTIADSSGTIVYVNDADARSHGYAPGELLGRSSTIYAVPRPASGAAGNPPPEGGWLRERSNRRRDGSDFPVRLFSESVLDSDGHVVATVTLCEDISDEVAAARALVRRDRILQAVARTTESILTAHDWAATMRDVLFDLGAAAEAEGAAFVPDPMAAIETVATEPIAVGSLAPGWAAGTWSELFERLRSSDAAPLVLPEQLDRLPDVLRRELAAAGVERALLVPATSAAGLIGLVAIFGTGAAHDWSAGEVDALRVAARLIGVWHERQRAARALASAEQGYRELIEGGSDMVLSVAADGRLAYVNSAWCSVLGYTAEEAARLSISDVIEPGQLENCRSILGRLLRERRSERVETLFRTRDGRTVVVDGNLSTRKMPDGELRTIGVFRDVTERAELERMRREFISTVSHELRTPLTSILGSLGLLRHPRMAEDKAQLDELLTIAYRNSERLLRLVNDLLDLQKMAEGRLRLDIGAVALGDLVDEVVAGIRGYAAPLRVEVLARVTRPRIVLRTDRNRTGQILLNLLSNAIRYSPPDRVVRLSAEPSGIRVVFSVEDEGPGIPLDFQRRMFDRFAQSSESAGAPRSGSGLGLAIVKRLVDQCGGTIAVDSAPGRGTRIRVELPLELQPSESPGRRDDDRRTAI